MSSALKSSLSARWLALLPRERLALTVAALVVGLGLLWWVLLSPALQTLRAADVQRVELERQHQLMLALQTEAQALQSLPKLSSSDALRALETAVKQTLGSNAQLNVVGERATVTVKAVSADSLAQWLAQTRVNAHALPTEAKLTRTPNGNATAVGANAPHAAVTWDGTLVMRLP
jgi:general secretion pathway protein M